MRLPSPSVPLVLGALVLGGCATANAPRFAVHSGIVYARPGGHPLRATLYLPPEGTPPMRRAAVLIHGGAWVGGTRRQMYWYARRMAERGYVVLSISYRKMFSHPFPACLHDAKAAVRWMRLHAEEYGVDPEAIVAMGESAGGHLTALLAVTQPEDGLDGDENPGVPSHVNAAIVLYGPTDLQYYAETSDGFFSRLGIAATYMDRFTRPMPGIDAKARLRAASPIYYVRPGAAPTLFVQGTDDGVVPADQAREMREALSQAGVPSRLISVPKRGHIFDYLHPADRARLFPEMLAFLDQVLPPPPK